MLAFDLIRMLDPELAPAETKIHLATYDGVDNPLSLLRSGGFAAWQARQSRQNFQCRRVVALVEMPGRDRWLFGGVYDSRGCKPAASGFVYDLVERPGCTELNARLVCGFRRPGRQPYLLASRWSAQVRVVELLEQPHSLGDFPGFKSVLLRKQDLDAIVRAEIPSWRVALSSVGGVYLICDDKEGKLYVGSAYGAGGFWQRWSTYACTGHGDNLRLRELAEREGPERMAKLRYSILEIADAAVNRDDVIQREKHWKNVLGTRAFGLNCN